MPIRKNASATDFAVPLGVVIIHGAYGGTDELVSMASRVARERGDRRGAATFPHPSRSISLRMVCGFRSRCKGHANLLYDPRGSWPRGGVRPSTHWASDEPVTGVFLAAGFVGALGLPDDIPSIYRFRHALRLGGGSVAERAGSRLLGGRRRPLCPLGALAGCGELLDAPLKISSGGDHLNSETGFVSFPQIRDAILPACLPIFK